MFLGGRESLHWEQMGLTKFSASKLLYYLKAPSLHLSLHLSNMASYEPQQILSTKVRTQTYY